MSNTQEVNPARRQTSGGTPLPSTVIFLPFKEYRDTDTHGNSATVNHQDKDLDLSQMSKKERCDARCACIVVVLISAPADLRDAGTCAPWTGDLADGSLNFGWMIYRLH
jgi:hypothetical protein